MTNKNELVTERPHRSKQICFATLSKTENSYKERRYSRNNHIYNEELDFTKLHRANDSMRQDMTG